ncbi:MAG: Rossman fold protein, TIGR00730 family [Acidobacteria bacterium RIFCSPLOWO2_12_FULL_67_14b]|nr:MAG: Rossman fold protein, TIGR00730 family [Acidobacteria bacterium RIFCSPLOWO2_12_FULL_67_14b]
MKRICVFCGSSVGVKPVYAEAARDMGRLIASRGIGLVYGGGNVGLMGVIADAALEAGGEVIGVIPHALADREIAHAGLTNLHVVDSMHTRKAMMAELADAFVAMPGGVGTFEEFFEAVTWTQLGLHRKACGLLNVDSFYTPLALFIDQAVTDGFIRPVHRQGIVVDSDPERLLDTLSTIDLPYAPKWIRRDET